jgi:hypothetical protein
VIPARAAQRLCLAVDLRQYSQHTPDEHIDAQTRLVRVVEHAVRRARIARLRVQRQDQGDGLLAVFPPVTDDVQAVPGLVLGLRDGLYQANRSPGPFGRLRLRAALGRGSIARSSNGYVGNCVIAVSRMVDSAGLRAALEDRGHSDLALAVTDDLHADVIARGTPGLPASEFTRVELANPGKDFSAAAWLYVPRSAPARDLTSDAVRWGYSPTRTAMREYVVPALTAVHAVAVVGHLAAPSSPLREWVMPSHGGSHGGPDPNFDEVDGRPSRGQPERGAHHHVNNHDSAHHGHSHHDSGHHDSGHHDSGHHDSGHHDSGHHDSGHHDSGHNGHGHHDSGHHDHGHHGHESYDTGHHDDTYAGHHSIEHHHYGYHHGH